MSKFRHFDAKIKTSSDVLENVDTSQSEGAEYESDWFQFKPKFVFNINQF